MFTEGGLSIVAKAEIITNLDAHAPTGDNARIIAAKRLEEMYNWDRIVDDAYDVQALHNLRIAAKRLRYTLEIFAETFPEENTAIIKEVERIQEELGALHDSDVMIALLRLCLGGQDSGAGYEQVLASVARQSGKGQFAVNPEMLEYILVPGQEPSAEQRLGLEMLLRELHTQRDEQYTSFRKHWYQLKERDFRREVLALLAA